MQYNKLNMKQKAFEYKVIFENHLMRKGVMGIERARSLVNKSPHLKKEKVYPCFYVRELFGLPDEGTLKWGICRRRGLIIRIA